MRAIRLSLKDAGLLLLALAAACSMCLYWSRIVVEAPSHFEFSAELKPKALGDLYPRWYGARELLLHHRDPYGDAVSREIQIAYYGKELDPSRPEDRLDQQRFAYPLYFVFFIAPLVGMEFHSAQLVFWWVLAVCAVLSLVLWQSFLRLRLTPVALAVLFLLCLSSIPVLQSLSIRQPFLLTACLIAAAAATLVSGRLFLAGILLALATIKPQVCLLPIGWFAMWVFSDWAQRRSLFWGFTTALAALTLAAEGLQPGWVIAYPKALSAYAAYTKTTSLLAVLLSPAWAWSVTALMLFTAVRFGWQSRRQPASSGAFAVSLAFALTLTPLVVPAVIPPFNHVLILPVILLAIRYWKQLEHGKSLLRLLCVVLCCIASLPWLFAAVVTLGLLKPLAWILGAWFWPLNASLALPFAAFAILLPLRGIVSPRPGFPTEAIIPSRT